MDRILITGGAGMIGSNLVSKLVAFGHDVIVVDNLSRGKIEYLQNMNGDNIIDINKRFFNRDLRTPGVLDDLLPSVDYVYHLADIVAGIGFVFNNQGSIFRNNILINSNVVDSCRRASLKGFIYVGTACSFPKDKQYSVDAPPLVEDDQYPADPESAYGWSKLMGEYEALLMEQETGLPVSILSLHNVYGTPTDFDPRTSQVIPSLILKAINWPTDDFIVWGSGSQGRAFIHVNDIVDALLKARISGFGKGVIQIGPGDCTSISEIAETIVKISGKPIQIKYDTSKPEGDRGRCADFTKAQNVLGWSPSTDIMAGLQELYSWINKQVVA